MTNAVNNKTETVHIIGCGLAGSEAAYFLAERGVKVVVHEMRPIKQTPAHHTGDCAELVCSNSLKSKDPVSAPGMMKAEMRMVGSLILSSADTAEVPAGGALAVDRDVQIFDIQQCHFEIDPIRFHRRNRRPVTRAFSRPLFTTPAPAPAAFGLAPAHRHHHHERGEQADERGDSARRRIVAPRQHHEAHAGEDNGEKYQDEHPALPCHRRRAVTEPPLLEPVGCHDDLPPASLKP